MRFLSSCNDLPPPPLLPSPQGPVLSEDVSAASSSGSSSVEISGLLSDAKTAARWPNPALSSDEVQTATLRDAQLAVEE